MINALRGKVLAVYEDSITLDVAGFGLEVFVSRQLLMQAIVGEELTCFAYLQISDAAVNLFGFAAEREKMLFMELLQVKTVGGKLAITLLRHLEAEQILQAIISGSPVMLTVPGLGAKRAERICFELKNKIAKKFADSVDGTKYTAADASFDSFVMDALMGLGFSQGEASRAISIAKANSPADTVWTEEGLLKNSLGILQHR